MSNPADAALPPSAAPPTEAEIDGIAAEIARRVHVYAYDLMSECPDDAVRRTQELVRELLLPRMVSASREGGSQPDDPCSACGFPRREHALGYSRSKCQFRSRERAAALAGGAPAPDTRFRDALLQSAAEMARIAPCPHCQEHTEWMGRQMRKISAVVPGAMVASTLNVSIDAALEEIGLLRAAYGWMDCLRNLPAARPAEPPPDLTAEELDEAATFLAVSISPGDRNGDHRRALAHRLRQASYGLRAAPPPHEAPQ